MIASHIRQERGEQGSPLPETQFAYSHVSRHSLTSWYLSTFGSVNANRESHTRFSGPHLAILNPSSR